MTRLELATLVFGSFLAGAVVSMAMPVKAGEICGRASFYGTESGSRTANGEKFDGRGLTAASRTLPFGTVLIVRNVQNGRIVRVRVNDRGPYVKGRFLDLSRAAALRLGMIRAGVAHVCAERL